VHEKREIEADVNRVSALQSGKVWWTWPGSNRRPPACKSGHRKSSCLESVTYIPVVRWNCGYLGCFGRFCVRFAYSRCRGSVPYLGHEQLLTLSNQGTTSVRSRRRTALDGKWPMLVRSIQITFKKFITSLPFFVEQVFTYEQSTPIKASATFPEFKIVTDHRVAHGNLCTMYGE
jgi:hypothetical protein